MAETTASPAITPVLLLYATVVCCVLSYVKDYMLFGTGIGSISLCLSGFLHSLCPCQLTEPLSTRVIQLDKEHDANTVQWTLAEVLYEVV